ncbi:MAG: hypothetical protein SGI92_02960 [Bryobacteraceae bacterium]|nr:hypothetical protein [Bryobacteraceae bacterium]
MNNWNLSSIAEARRLAMSISTNQVEHQMFASTQRHPMKNCEIAPGPEPAPLLNDGRSEGLCEVPGGGQA